MRGPRPDIDTATSDELAVLAAAGDTHAFARLIRLHHESMTRVAWLVTGDLPAAARAVRAAWVRAWTAIRGPHEPADPQPWLAVLAASEAVHTVHQAVDGVTLPGQPSWSGQPASALASLAGIEPADRALLALHDVVGVAPGTLDRVTDRPPGTALARLPVLRAALGVDDAATSARLLAGLAEVPVRPIDADALARLARAEEGEERLRRASIVIGSAAALVVTLFPLFAALLYGR